QCQPQLLPGSLLPAPAPHIEVTEALSERREPETCASTPVHAHRVARPCPPAVPGTHGMALRPSSVPLCVVLPEPPASSLPHVPDPESDLARAPSPTVSRLLATVVTDTDLESTTAFSLVTELVDFAATSRLDYVASLVTESESVSPPSVEGELALGSDVLEERQFELECLAAALPRFASMLLCPEGDPDAIDIPTPRSYAEAITGTYLNEVPPPGANIVDGMWTFRVQRQPGSPPAFKARYVAQGFSQRQGVDFFQTFSPTQKMTTLRVPWDDAKRVLRYLCSTLGMGIVLGGQGLVVLTGHSDASWADDQATQRSSQGYTFSLGSDTVSWRSTRSSSVLGSSCEAEIYAGAMAAQELRWLTYLLTDLGERPCSPPVLYVDNKAMLVWCHEQSLEHRTKHITLCYFLARELQQRPQLRLPYVASRANTADVFTKALRYGDHQRFCTTLGLVPTLPHLLVA
ncbi:unnamed protein product, partial [Closterium sp. NIES-54]